MDNGQVIIKRIISNNDKNRTYLNNSNLTVAALSKIGDRLIDIHGQHDHQSLLHPETHVDLLDHFGKLLADREAFAEHYAAYQKKIQTLRQMQTNQANACRDRTCSISRSEKLMRPVYRSAKTMT